MLVYEGIKSGFIDDVDLGIIADKIRNKYIEVIKKRPSAPEFNSWKNSMQYMRGVLSDNDIPNNTGIAIEYNIPPTGCRIDFMMSGYNKNKSNVVIVELKQWDKATEVKEMDGIYKVLKKPYAQQITCPALNAKISSSIACGSHLRNFR